MEGPDWDMSRTINLYLQVGAMRVNCGIIGTVKVCGLFGCERSVK